MNLNEISKRVNGNKIISIMICVLLVFSLFLGSYIQADAFAPAIPLVGAAVVLSLLIAFGVSTPEGIDGIGDLAELAYNEMSQELKNIMDRVGAEATVANYLYGVAQVKLNKAEANLVNDWFYEHYENLTDSFYVDRSAPENLNNYIWTGATNIHPDVAAAYNSSSNNKIMSFDGSDPKYQNRFNAFIGNFGVMFLADGTLRAIAIPSMNQSVTKHWCSGSSYYSTNYTNIDTPMGKIISFVGSFPIMDINNNILGYLSSGRGITYDRSMLFDPNKYPLERTPDGGVCVNVPVADVPANPDTNVQIPDASIDNPLSLEDIIAHYKSIDGFFDAGNAIILADGTIIGGLTGINEYVRSTDDFVGRTTTAEGVNDVSGIREIVKSIRKTLAERLTIIGTGIGEIVQHLSDPFNWKDKPSGPSAINGISAFFAVLLALLIAIMHLIAKVIAFIGQLYSIPASTAMLHPTMIQGIEWARGFHTSGGVNLYSLVTGVISIVLGVVCFKLLRKMITGIGSASPYEDNGINGVKLMNMADSRFK